MDKGQINQQIEQLQEQLRAEIKATNFEKASELQLQINRYRALLGNYRTNYDLEEHATPMSYVQVIHKIDELRNQFQGAMFANDFDAARKLSEDVQKYEEIVRLIDLDRRL